MFSLNSFIVTPALLGMVREVSPRSALHILTQLQIVSIIPVNKTRTWTVGEFSLSHCALGTGHPSLVPWLQLWKPNLKFLTCVKYLAMTPCISKTRYSGSSEP